MDEPLHGPYHRTGQPGGPPAELVALSIVGKGPNDEGIPAQLLDAQGDASEVGLLRAVCTGLGVSWGKDEFGWWAVVPNRLLDEP